MAKIGMNEEGLSRFDLRFAAGLIFLTACWLLLYSDSLATLVGQWNNEDYSYCYLVPPLAAYLAYQNRGRLRALTGGTVLPGYLALIFAAVLFVAGRLGSLHTASFASVWFSIAGIVILAFGVRSLKALSFPLLVLAFAIPAPPFITHQLTFKLRLVSSSLAIDILHLLGHSAYREGNIIDLGFTQLQVVDACSGLRYVLSTFLVALVAGYLFNKKWWERVLLLIAAVPVSIFVNSLRIVAVALLMQYVSPKFGEEGFYHDFSGWLIFFFSVGIVLLLSAVLRKVAGGSSETPETDAKGEDGSGSRIGGIVRPTAWYHLIIAGGIFLALLLVQGGLITSANLPERKNFQDFPLQIGEWRGKRSYLDQSIINSLHTDDYVTGSYYNERTGNALHLLVPFYAFQFEGRAAHAPTSCLLGSGWELKEKQMAPPDPAAGRMFSVGQMVLNKNGERILSNFWFQQRGRVITSEYLNKWYLFLDGLTRRRTDGALVRVEMVMQPEQSLTEAQAVLDGFTVPLMTVLREYIPD